MCGKHPPIFDTAIRPGVLHEFTRLAYGSETSVIQVNTYLQIRFHTLRLQPPGHRIHPRFEARRTSENKIFQGKFLCVTFRQNFPPA